MRNAWALAVVALLPLTSHAGKEPGPAPVVVEQCPSDVYEMCDPSDPVCKYDGASLNKQCENNAECVQLKLIDCCPQFQCEPPPPSPEKVACATCGDDSNMYYNCSAVKKCDGAKSKTCNFDLAKVKEHCGKIQDCIDGTLSTCCSSFGCDAPAGISHQSVYDLYNGDAGGNETFPFGPNDSLHDQWRKAIDEIKNSRFPSQTSLKAFDKYCCSDHEQIDPGCKNFDVLEHFQINCMHCPLASVDACNTYWTKDCFSMWGDPFISRKNTCREKINKYCCGDGKEADPACNPEKTDILRRLQLKFYVPACKQLDIETMTKNFKSVIDGGGATMLHQFTTLMLEYASSQSTFPGVSDPQANLRRLLATDTTLLHDLGNLLLQAFEPGIITATTTTNGLVNWVEVFSPTKLAAEPTSIALLLLRITASIGDSKDSNNMRLALLKPLMKSYPEALLKVLNALSNETFLTSKDVTDVDSLLKSFASVNLVSQISEKRNDNIEKLTLDEELWTVEEVQREFDQATEDIMLNALASNEKMISQANSGSSLYVHEAVHWDGQEELHLESNNVRLEPNICTRHCLVVANTKDARPRDLEAGIKSSVVQIVIKDASSGGDKSGDTGSNHVSIAFDGLGLGKENCPKCVHRNEQDPEAVWEDKDCSLVQTKTGAVCKCNHLSEFAIMEDSDSNCKNSIRLLGHEMWYGFFISYAMLGVASFVQAVRAYRNHGARSRGVMQIEHILIFVFSVARLVICAFMLQKAPNRSALTFFLALPFPLTVAVFTTMAAAWGSLAAKGGGRGRSEPFLQRRPAFGVLFVVAVFAMTFGLIYSNSSGSNVFGELVGSVELGVLDAVLRTMIMVCMTLAFLLYGWRLYGSLTKGNMRSKFASSIFMYASLFCILCSAQALLELVQSLERKWYEDHIAWVHGSQLALECSSMVCVMMVFRRAVGQHRGGKVGRTVTIYPGKTFKKIKTISVMPSSRESQIETPPLSVGTIGVGNSADLEAEGINQDHQRHLARASLRFDDSKARQLQMAQNMKGAKKELLKMLKVSDIDGDGRLSFPEFKALLNTSNESYAQKLFAKLDVDGDGSLDRSELRAYMKEKIKREA